MIAMYESMHARLQAIAKDDSDREEDLGFACPSRLGIYLSSGYDRQNCRLMDGENSIDDASIDVMFGEPPVLHIIAIAHIAMLSVIYPTDADEARARAMATARGTIVDRDDGAGI